MAADQVNTSGLMEMVVQQNRHDKRKGQLCPYAWLVKTNNPPFQFHFLSNALPVAGSEWHLTTAALWSVSAMQREGLYLTR